MRTVWDNKCSSCLAEAVWSEKKKIKTLRAISSPRFEVHRNENNTSKYLLVEFSKADERDVKNLTYFDYVIENEDFFHFYRRFARIASSKKMHLPDYLVNTLELVKEDEE